MKTYGWILGAMLTHTILAQPTTSPEAAARDEFRQATQAWFSAWQLVSTQVYKINDVKAVDFIFFDEQYVYSTSDVVIPEGEAVAGEHLMNLQLTWKRALHKDSITLPDRSVLPVGLMSFASDHNGKPFFIMPLPGFWKQAGVDSQELGFMNLITGVFVHEFSHSQQMNNFGRQMTAFEEQQDFGVEFSDNLVQDLFGQDTIYTSLYKKEVASFFAATANGLDKRRVKAGLKIMKERHRLYFTDTNKNLGQIDDFFLTMEGLGQYSMYRWLVDPQGGNIQKALAIKGVRRGGKWWSQDEGFALFLILENLTSPANWAGELLGDRVVSVNAILAKYL